MRQDRLHKGVARNIQLIILLQSRDGYKVDELAAKLKVSRRTIFRDLRQLSETGFPIDLDPEGGRYRLGKLKPILMSGSALWEDFLTVAAAALSSPWMENIAAQHKIRQALTRILDDTPADYRKCADKALGTMDRDSWGSVSPQFAEKILTILTAIGAGQLVRVEGLSTSGPSSMPLRIIPKTIQQHHQVWVLIGESVANGERCVFELSRCVPTEDTLDEQGTTTFSFQQGKRILIV